MEKTEFRKICTEYFSTLGHELDRSYETGLTKFSDANSAPACREVYLALLDEADAVAYPAFFCLCTIYRRVKDYEKLGKLLQAHGHFSDHPSYNHLKIMYLVHSESLYDYEEVLEGAYQDARRARGNSGYWHTFANAYATICENCEDEDLARIVRDWSDRALEAVNDVIGLEPDYAKYYSTKARILSTRGSYSEAIRLLQYAISIEKSDRKDYALVVANYQYYRLQIAMKQGESRLLSRLAALEQGGGKLKKLDAGQKKAGPRAYGGREDFVFISYSHADSDAVFAIIRKLQQQGLNIWYDEGITPGAEWSEEVARRILECSSFFVFLSENAIKSINVRKEINLALAEHKHMVVVQLEDVLFTPGMRLQLSLHQFVNRTAMDEERFIQRLCQTVEQREDEENAVLA